MDRHYQLKERQMRAMILLSMVLLAPAGNAQQVYKCAKGKDVSYQSTPCDGTQKTLRQWDATPEPEPSVEDIRQHQFKSGRERAESAQLSRAAGTDRPRSVRSVRRSGRDRSSMSRCDTAKSRRDAKLKAVGLKRTFDLLRKLDDAVNEACKQI